MSDKPIQVHYEAAHEAPTFNAVGDPMLIYGWHPTYENCWTLCYLEPDGNGVDDHIIPGDLSDIDQVVASAQDWLRLISEHVE